MALREDLLNPIPGDNPSGENLRYDPLYDQIKEARRQEEELSQGIWQHEVKQADFSKVIKLAGDALAERSKDLQLAAWLTEALIYEEGIPGLRRGLTLIRELMEQFWDTLHPELEDGDPYMRTGILDWVGSRLDDALKRAPLTRGGYGWYDYRESRAVGYEADCEGDSEKLEARQAAIEEGKLTAEDFDADVSATPKSFYVELKEELGKCFEELRALEDFTDEHFADDPPSFSGLKATLEELDKTVHVLLAKKKEQEPDVQPEPEPQPQPQPEPEPAESTAWAGEEPAPAAVEEPPPSAAPSPAPAPAAAVSAEPADREDAIRRIVNAAAYLRKDDQYSPLPYLVLRGLRWGELRASSGGIDPTLLEPPPSDVRQELKRMSLNSEWEGVLEKAEEAMGLPCGRGWLDLQRYVVRACTELGSWYDPIVNAIRSELRALLTDFPDLPEMTLMDDTPTANRETQEWLKEFAAPMVVEKEVEKEPEVCIPEMPAEASKESGLGEEAAPDPRELAQNALREGRPEEAMAILAREIGQVKSGRERFRRRVELAEICLASDKAAIALPILQDIAAEIEKRRLEEWEAPETVAHALVLLYRCMTMLDLPAEEKQPVYQRICRLDPVQAMACT